MNNEPNPRGAVSHFQSDEYFAWNVLNQKKTQKIFYGILQVYPYLQYFLKILKFFLYRGEYLLKWAAHFPHLGCGK